MDPDHQILKIVGAGLPRTGTTSLKSALTFLLGGKCFHGSDIAYLNDEEYDFWLTALERKGNLAPHEWRRFFKDYKATLDLPSIVFYKELLDAFPEAKVIFTDRDEESWFHSWWRSIGQQLRVINKAPYRWIKKTTQNPKLERLHNTARNYVPPWFDMCINDAFSDIKLAKRFYKKWKQEVINSVPANRLLIMRVEHGWPQLCEFLGHPVPSIIFPRDNESAKVQLKVRRIEHCNNAFVMVAALLGFLVMIVGIFRTLEGS